MSSPLVWLFVVVVSSSPSPPLPFVRDVFGDTFSSNEMTWCCGYNRRASSFDIGKVEEVVSVVVIVVVVVTVGISIGNTSRTLVVDGSNPVEIVVSRLFGSSTVCGLL